MFYGGCNLFIEVVVYLTYDLLWFVFAGYWCGTVFCCYLRVCYFAYYLLFVFDDNHVGFGWLVLLRLLFCLRVVLLYVCVLFGFGVFGFVWVVCLFAWLVCTCSGLVCVCFVVYSDAFAVGLRLGLIDCLWVSVVDNLVFWCVDLVTVFF